MTIGTSDILAVIQNGVTAINNLTARLRNSSVGTIFQTVANVRAANISTTVNGIETLGYNTGGDGGGAFYKRVSAEPTHQGKIQSADGTWWEIVNITFINVKSLGAIGDGATDDTVAIQNAIDALSAIGGTVIFPVGVYLVSSTINMGDGSGVTASTKQGIRLLGMGGTWNSEFGFDGGGVELRTSGNAMDFMISVNGPIQGWGISNIYLHNPAQDVAIGLLVNIGVLGLCENLSISDFFLAQLISRVDDPGIIDCINNTYIGLALGVPDQNGAIGLKLQGAGIASPTHDTDYNVFTDLAITIGGDTFTTVGIYLEVCDSNFFYGVRIGGGGANPGNRGIVFDYSTDNSYPNSNKFYGYDCGFPCAQVGTPGSPSSSQVNEFYGIVETNGGSPPYGIDNVSWVAGNNARFGNSYLVADLPSPISNATMRAFVSDATVTTFASVVAGTGGNFVPVYSDGTNWRIG